MQIRSRRFHIAGSAHADAPIELLAYSHSLIASLCDHVAASGGAFTTGVGREPFATAPASGAASPATVFDWTVLERVAAHVIGGGSAHTLSGPIVTCILSSKTESQIPAHRRALWETLKTAGAVSMEFLDGGWSSGAVTRQRQERVSDVLLLLSGGEGAEHLAELYVQAGKPVIPLDLDLANTTSDGSGGTARLYKTALKNPVEFFRVREPSRASLLISELRSDMGKRAMPNVVAAVTALLDELTEPALFCVRLMNPNVLGFAAVEQYFRGVIRPLGKELGYTVFETGQEQNEYAWMNEEIFDKLHYSSAVIVDVTGLRNNCFMELGYALGRQQKVIVTAMEGTTLPFDSATIPHHFWKPDGDDQNRKSQLQAFWKINIGRPPLTRSRTVL